MPATFDNALEGLRLAGLRLTGPSVDTEDLVELLVHHGREEGRLLAEYERVADDSADQATRYVVGLILEDERRHHRLLAELANAMAWEVATISPESSTPGLTRPIDGELLAQTRRLLRAERADYRKLRTIRRRFRPYRRTTLWALVIDLMLADTTKHATMLRFLERRRRPW